MPYARDERIFETSTTTGTGAYALAAAVPGGYRRFNQIVDPITGVAIAVGDVVPYVAFDVDANYAPTGAGWEIGLGTYSAANTLTRTTVRRSSNSNAAVSWAAGTRVVAVGALASLLLQADQDGAFLMKAATAEPSTPGSGLLYFYAREILTGHVVPRVKGPDGPDHTLQIDVSLNRVQTFQGNGTAMVATNAAALTASAAGTAVTPASGTAASQLCRILYSSTAVAGNVHTLISPSDSNCPVLRGNVQGQGGFRHVIRFNLNQLQTGNRGFWGIAASRTAGTNIDPTTTAAPARVGLCINASTGNWQLVRSDGTNITNVDLGANFPVNTTDLMELVLFCRPHNGTTAGDIVYRVRRYTTNADNPAQETSGTLSTNIPAATTLLHPWVFFTNNAAAAVVSWHLNRIAIQSDW